MVTMFRTSRGIAGIFPVEVDRKTEGSIWVAGRRKAKESDWDNYHDTWTEAQRFLVHKGIAKTNAYKKRLQESRDHLRKCQELTYKA